MTFQNYLQHYLNYLLMKKLQNYLLLAIMLFGNAIAALASNYGDVFKNTRSDFRDESIYFVMTTRFFD